MDFLGSPALAKIHVFVYKGSSFRHTAHGDSAGGMLGNARSECCRGSGRGAGQYPGRALSRSNTVPAFIKAAEITILSQTCPWHKNAKTLVTREAERNCLSAWSFFPHIELFQQMLIKL